jgi:hypothetical protein
MSRTQLYLVGLLIVQVLLILLVRSPFSKASAGVEARALLPVLEAITPNRLEILGPDDESIRLAREGESWRVESLDGFPADDEKVEELLSNLADLRVRRPVVSSGRYHETFKVADDVYERRIRLWAVAGSDAEVDLFIGSSPNFRTSHVRRAGEDAVYEVRGLSSYDVRPASSGWIERELVQTDETRVVGFTLSNESGSFELVREDGIWKHSLPERDDTLDQGKVEAFVRTVSSVRLDDAVGPVDSAAHGFTSPAATLVLRWSDTLEEVDGEGAVRELTLTIGQQLPDNESRRYITRDGFEFTGTVWESSVRRLLEETLDDLLAS